MNLLYDPSKQQRKRRVLLYGVPKIGKTTWARSAPGVIEIPTEDANCTLGTTAFPISKTYAEFLSYVKAVGTTDNRFETLVIDSLDWLEPLIWDAVCKDDRSDSIEKVLGGYGKGFTVAAGKWLELLNMLELINLGHRGESAAKGPGMTIILLAHSRVVKHTEPGLDSFDKYVTPLQKQADNMVREWCDDVLFCNYRIYTSEKDAGFNKKEVRAVGAGERVIHTNERPGFCAGNRLNLPNELSMNWSEYAKFAYTIPDTANPKPARKTPELTPEPVSTVAT